MVDSLLRLRHHIIVSRNNDDGDIRHFRTTGTHSRKCLMTWSIQESNLTSVLHCHVVGTDMLCDTTRLTGDNIRLTDIVEQWSLTMVYVSHHSYNRRTRFQIFLRIFFFDDSLCHFRTYIFRLKAELFCHQINRFRIQTLVDRNHYTDTHTSSDNLINRYIHHTRQLIGCYELRQLQHFAFFHLLVFQFLHTVGNHLPFFLTVFGSLVFTFRCQTS